MVSIDDKIKYFRSELKNYTYYRKSYDDITLKLEALNVKLQGVSSTPPKEIIAGASSVRYYTDNKIELILQEEELVNERQQYADRINFIEDKLDTLDTEDKKVLVDLFIKNKSYAIVADENYISIPSLQRKVKRTIKKLI